ncbi:hypothetical protein SKAU_G00285200, partial [Synaphobranchus kaupii]
MGYPILGTCFLGKGSQRRVSPHHYPLPLHPIDRVLRLQPSCTGASKQHSLRQATRSIPLDEEIHVST